MALDMRPSCSRMAKEARLALPRRARGRRKQMAVPTTVAAAIPMLMDAMQLADRMIPVMPSSA